MRGNTQPETGDSDSELSQVSHLWAQWLTAKPSQTITSSTITKSNHLWGSEAGAGLCGGRGSSIDSLSVRSPELLTQMSFAELQLGQKSQLWVLQRHSLAG